MGYEEANKEGKRAGFQSEEVSKRIDDYLTKLESNRSNMGEIYAEMDEIETSYANEQEIVANRPNSRINILNANIEGQVASLVEQNLAVACRGEGPSDEPFANWGRIGLDWTLRKNRIKKILDIYVRRWDKFGWAWLKIYFDPKAIKEYGLVKICPVPPQNIFIDMKITDPLRVQEAEYIAEVILQTKTWAEEQDRYKDKANNIFYNGTDKATIFHKERTTDDEDAFWLVQWWSFKDGVLRLEEFSDDGVLLYDSLEDEDYKEGYYRYNKYPYFLTVMYPKEGQLYGFGDGKLLMPLQQMINDLYDQIRRAARPNRIFFDEESEVDLEDIDEDDGPLPCRDPNRTVRIVEVGKVNPALWQLLNNIHVEAQRVTRFSELMMGQGAKAKTATEAAIQQQQGNSAVDHKKLMLQETLIEMCEYMLDMMMEHYTEAKAFRIDENKDDYEWIDFRQLNEVPVLMPAAQGYSQMFQDNNPGADVPKWQQLEGETKSVDFDIDINIGAGLPKNKAFLWQMFEALSKAVVDNQSVIKWDEFRDFIRDYLGIPLKDNEEVMQTMGQPGMAPGQPPGPGQPPMPPQGADVPGMSPGGAPMTSSLPPSPPTGGVL